MKKFAVLFVLLLALTTVLYLGTAAAETLVLPADTTVIGAEAFYGADAETIILPEGVTVIGDRAFGGSSTLQIVYVPEALMGREEAALQGSPSARFVSRNADWTETFEYTIGEDAVTIDLYKGNDTEVIIPAVIRGKPVTKIGNNAFKNQAEITRVVIPEGVTELGIDAFYSCYKLTNVVFPDSLQRIGSNAFRYCGSQAEGVFYYRLPDHLTYIEGVGNNYNFSFTDCKAVKVVTPDSDTARLLSTAKGEAIGWFTYPGEEDFRYIFYQSEENGPYDTLHLMKYVGTGTEVVIPDHGTASTRIGVIHKEAFYGKENITSVVIPEGVTELGIDAFHSCYKLTSVAFPDSLQRIGSNAFRECGSQAEGVFYYRLPDHLTYIEGIGNNYNFSFTNCKAVKVVTPDSDTARLLSTARGETIGWFTYPGEEDFRYIFYQSEEDGAYDTLHLMKYVGTDTEVAIPNHGTESTRIGAIHKEAFYGKQDITSVVIPEGVTELGIDAFHSCYKLTSVVFPDSLQRIGSNAFRECGSQAEGVFYYRLPDHLTYIEGIGNNYNFSFTNCKAVKVVTPDSDTARLLSTAGGETRGWFTYPGEEDFRYIFYQSEEGGAYDTLYLMSYTGTDTEVIIPDHGTASTRISIINDNAFKNMAALTGVAIPEGVSEIRTDAFFGDVLLSDVSFPSTLTAIGRNAFRACASEVSRSVIYDLPSGITSIESDSFNDCTAKLCCDKYVTEGYSDTTPTYQQLGDRWSGWGDGAFRLADYPVPYRIDEEHTGYIMKKKLIGYVAEMAPNGTRSVTIPEDVVFIDEDCFRGRTDLGHIIMPYYGWTEDDLVTKSVYRIGARAFMECSYLTDINFNMILTYIGANAFTGCGNSAGISYTFAFSFPQDILIKDKTEPDSPFYDCDATLMITRYEAYPRELTH